MNKHLLLILIINIFIFRPLYAAVYIDQPIEKYIGETQLIVKGTISKKDASKEEHSLKQFTMSNGVISEERILVNEIFTTFTVEVDEVLYGKYDNKVIEIKMLGGCDEVGTCLRLSSNYDYEIDNNVLLFLNFDDVNKFFHSTANGITAFLVKKNGQIEKSADLMAYNNQESIINEVLNEKSLSLAQLKNKIKGYRNEN